jgi:hypothetical protein
MTDNPWAFGWNQLIAIIGFVITIGIAVGGYRTLESWRREKIEDRKVETAFEALSLAYESKSVFGLVRSSLAYEYEWKDMPTKENEHDRDRKERGSYFAVLKRMSDNRDFFDRVWKLQPKFMAMFGHEAEAIFNHLHAARSIVRLAAQRLTWELPIPPIERSEEDLQLRLQLREDIWAAGPGDRVEKLLQEFRTGIERMCGPVINREFKERRT